MTETAAGPFAVGDRVYIEQLGSEGVIDAVGETKTIRVFGIGVANEGEIRHVTFYDVKLDRGDVRSIADRDGHIVRA